MAADDVQSLINKGMYAEASEALDSMEDGERKWFLKGTIALKRKNYELAQELFAKATEIRKKPEYFRMMGIAHLEILEVEPAIEDFIEALKLDRKDVTSHFFISVCYLFLDNPLAEEHMKEARRIDKKKTWQLLDNFYTLFIKHDPQVESAQKRKMEETIRKLGLPPEREG